MTNGCGQHEERLGERLETLQAIARMAQQAVQAILDCDLDRLIELAAERERLFIALRAVDRALAAAAGPVAESALGRTLREQAEAVHRRLVPTEEALRAQLDRWRAETRSELMGIRRTARARRSYASESGA